MTKFATAVTFASLVVAATSFGNAVALSSGSSLRADANIRNRQAGGRSLEEQLNAKMDILLNRIDSLENQVTELQEHRKMAEACGFTLSDDGTVCQLRTPLELFSDLVVQGNNTSINGDLEVEGKSVLKGDSTVFSKNMSVTGHTSLNSLNVATALKVFGESSFRSTVEASEEVRLARDLTVSGRSSLNRLVVREELEVQGETTIDGDVTIEGGDNEFVVEGPVTFEDNLRVEGDAFFAVEVIEGDFEVDGELLVTNKATFKGDVQIDRTAEIDELVVQNGCVGCV